MAHKTTLVVFEQQERRAPLIFIIMFKTTKTHVQAFNSAQFGELRTHQALNGIIWFCLNDVMRSLGLTHVTELKKRLNEKGCNTIAVPTNGGKQHAIFIDEPNLYRCIFQSRKKEAEKFQSWVFEEVLPAIRQSGGYISTQQEDTPELIMARALQVAQTTIERHKQQLQIVEAERDHYQEEVKVLAPKAEYTDNVLQSTSTYTMTQVAKELGFTCAAALCNKLKAIGVMFRQSGQWMLTAKHCGKDLTKTRTHHYTHSDGRTGSNTITVFTEKGRMYLHSLQEGCRL